MAGKGPPRQRATAADTGPAYSSSLSICKNALPPGRAFPDHAAGGYSNTDSVVIYISRFQRKKQENNAGTRSSL